jgi:acetate kinase
VEKLTEPHDLILALNSGSSSLKFGIYRRGSRDEEPLLTGSADGIGHSNGSLHIRAADGTSLVQRESVHESQNHALTVLLSVMAQYIHGTPEP